MVFGKGESASKSDLSWIIKVLDPSLLKKPNRPLSDSNPTNKAITNVSPAILKFQNNSDA